MLNNQQIKLVQTAVRAAGIRSNGFDGRYLLLLSYYIQPNGRPVKSCKQLNNSQLDDLLAICEAQGWQYPGRPEDFFRKKIAAKYGIASFAQQEAIKYLAGDLGWLSPQLNGFISRMTAGQVANVAALTPSQAYNTIEALKAIVGRKSGRKYQTLNQVRQDMEVATDGSNQI